MGAVVAAISARKERDLIALFQRAHATSPATAQSLSGLGVRGDIALRRLRDREVIRESSPGVYYLDAPSWEALTRLRDRMVWVVLGLAVVMAAIAFLVSRAQTAG